MILPVFESLQQKAIAQPMVNMCSYGDIYLYENKKDIKYPFVNFDIVKSTKKNSIMEYVIRVYICDRNVTVFNAYDKCEVIATQFLDSIEVNSYSIQYFTLNFKDVVDGIFIDFIFQARIENNCDYKSIWNDYLLKESGFTQNEQGDIIII
jgi:hypothetical protein